MEAARASKALVSYHITTQHHNLDDDLNPTVVHAQPMNTLLNP